MKVPSPQELGLPEKFSDWRTNQEHAISVMITSGNRVTALSAPTGFGKSPAYVAFALISGKSTCVVTSSKGLQAQLMEDYRSVGMVDLRGKANYQCALRDDYSCQEGYATRCPYKTSVMCPYNQAELRTRTSRLVVTNYDKWMTSAGEPDSWAKHFEQVVFDEGHDAPEALAQAMRITLTTQDIERVLELDYPLHVDQFSSWRMWAARAKLVAEEKMLGWKFRIEEEINPHLAWIREYLHLKRLVNRLAILATGFPTNWVVEEVGDGFQFDPIRAAQYAEGVLLLRVPRIVIVSATLRPKTMYMLGLRKDAFDFYEFDSDFDRDRCPIYWIPTMRVDIRATDLSPLWIRLDQIMSRRRDRKGIIHTISYDRRDVIMAHSRFRSTMITNQRGESISSVIDAFRGSDPGTVLISPSIGTGYDFPLKDCEWQFLCKIPFPDGRSKILKARQEADKEYGPYLAMQAMVQAFGRSMRMKEDRSESFIGDDHLSWFLPKFAHLAPKSFHMHFRKVGTVPQPPPAL